MKRYRLVIIAGIVACTSAAWADTVELPLTDDAYINANAPDVVTGAWLNISVHNYGPKRGLVRFDAASLAGLDIGEATLTLFLNDIKRDGTMSVHPITSGWSETTVTWNNQPPAAILPVAVVDLTTGDEGSFVSIDVTATVRRWADGDLADAGFMMMTGDGIRAFFDAKELAGGTPATLVVETGEPAYASEAVVLDLSHLASCLIDAPGHYVLDRSWDGSSPTTCLSRGPLSIEAQNVLLDLKGHKLVEKPQAGVLSIEGSNVTVKNGSLVTRSFWPTGGNNRLERLSVRGRVVISGSGGHFIDSTISSVIELSADDFRLQNLEIDAGGPNDACIHLGPDARNAIIRGNFCWPGQYGILINANEAIVEGNVLLHQPTSVGLHIWSATGVKVLRNILLYDGGQQGLDAILVLGDGHVIDGNLVDRGGYVRGLNIPGAGNFFGNNRVSAFTPYIDTGDDTDWGGNVSF